MFGRKPQSPPDLSAIARDRMIETQLRRRGIHDPATLAAMTQIPRHAFVAEAFRARAYDDEALPSLEGQTISQPYVVAAMTEQLALASGQRVLEVGTGTGYQTAILAHIVGPAGRVFSIERVPSLAQAARRQLETLRLSNVEIQIGDGSLGWPAVDTITPQFDRILITAGAPDIPHPLLAQLADGGILVAPIGDSESQIVTRVNRIGDRFETVRLFNCRFVPLVGVHAWKE